MLKEICITPQVFDYHNIGVSGWKEIKSVLEAICDSGYILGLNNKDWNRIVLHNINRLEPKIRDRLQSVLSLLKSRDRIVGHPKSEGSLVDESNEKDWFKKAIELDKLRKVHDIIATESFDGKAISIEQLEGINIYEKFGIVGSQQYVQTRKNLHKIFLHSLSYSKKVTLIDPYFNLDKRDFKVTFKILAETFRNRRGRRDKGKIQIHCKLDDQYNFNYEDCISEPKKREIERWQKELIEISRKYGHDVKLCAWEVMNKKFHDRYIITNQCGLVSAAGTACDNKLESEWSIKDYRELNEILSRFTENANVYTLKCTVTTSSIEYR